MRFIAPRVFYLLLVILPLAAALLIRAAVRRKLELDKVLSPRRGRDSALLLSPTARFLRHTALVAALAALGFAAARPYWSSKLLPTTERGRDIAVIFDVSKSMLAKDIAPSRLEHAKFLLRDLAKRSQGDRFGLIAFAGKAYTACPLTADPVAFDEYVNELSPAMAPLGGTNLELALREALRLFKGAGGDRAVVVMTDGDELSGNASQVASELKDKHILLFIIGLGDPTVPAPLPDENGRLRRDGSGKIITSKLNEAALQKLAQATGGVYVRSTVTDTGADVIAAHISALGKNVYGGGKRSIPEEKFPYFILAALVLLGFFLALPERRARRMTLFLLGLFAMTAVSAGPPPPPPPPGMEILPAASGEKLPADPAELYNLGVAKQNAGDSDAAKAYYEKVLGHRPPEERLRMKALFNLGVDEHRQGRDKLAAAQTQVQSQQLDKALEELEAARQRADAADELYSQALGATVSTALEDEAATDLQLLARDRKAIEELKKKIEELKKQQQKAQQSARNAQRQNRQQKQQKPDRQQQKQQQEQQKQDKQQQQDQQPDRQQQKQQQEQQKQDRRQSRQQQSPTDSARNESEKLREQAEKLGQKELEKHAAQAAEELKKAREAQDKEDLETAQKHLDNAVRELGSGEEDNPRSEKPEKPNKKNDAGSGEKKSEQKTGVPEPAEPKASPDDRKGAEQLLKLLNDEEKQRRGELRKMRDARRVQVERDW